MLDIISREAKRKLIDTWVLLACLKTLVQSRLKNSFPF